MPTSQALARLEVSIEAQQKKLAQLKAHKQKIKAGRSGGARDRVAENLRARRAALGLSQDDLSNLCGLHRTFISSVERSRRNVSLDSLERLAAAVGLDVVDLLEAAQPKSK